MAEAMTDENEGDELEVSFSLSVRMAKYLLTIASAGKAVCSYDVHATTELMSMAEDFDVSTSEYNEMMIALDGAIQQVSPSVAARVVIQGKTVGAALADVAELFGSEGMPVIDPNKMS